uniref:Uncharacterized protein n=1 Tax=Francisella tularensis subsp. tularensis TaxID=119856 RepID=Q7WZK7_FRATL|nr:unknown [Francisella tularensis subsp. tularensis]
MLLIGVVCVFFAHTYFILPTCAFFTLLKFSIPSSFNL